MRMLVIDDEESMRHMLSVLLKREGYDVVSAENGRQALEVVEEDEFDFILCDIKMPGMGGLDFLKAILSMATSAPAPVVIMMSAYGTVDTAIECMQLGAYDYISKPFKPDEVIITIRKAEERERLKRENMRLKEELRLDYTFENIVAEDPKMHEIFDLIRKVASYNTTILINGESGTGKELIARAIHFNGDRRDKPFIPVNCGAIPATLMESELFGYVKGAFTDAVRNREGLFQEADGGTLFLDEIGELPKELQVKLLRVLQEGEVRRVGDTRSRSIDVRVVAATARDLQNEVREGAFREDLYYRLNVIPITLPPLRERGSDIPLLVDHFIGIAAHKFGKPIDGISDNALELLMSYRWPGNVRELENIIERAVILEDGDTISPVSLPFTEREFRQSPSVTTHLTEPELSIKKAHEAVERELIARALEATGGNRTRAAELLEISHRALLYKIKSYKIQ
ncbi:MAG: sigma-54-dependent Fis family transcriptional regulator [Deltaproteobacteria bacterium]|nr:sigma-54-dependent Fis family transcriptional regulator [Deltaproteobacteria bacterium]